MCLFLDQLSSKWDNYTSEIIFFPKFYALGYSSVSYIDLYMNCSMVGYRMSVKIGAGRSHDYMPHAIEPRRLGSVILFSKLNNISLGYFI